MAELYADLIELGLRVFENPKNDEIEVPLFLKERVREELIKRGHTEYAKKA